jgi:transcriptional regulator with XRE-family HTH domain
VTEQAAEIVPGMADAIEERRLARGLTPGAFAAAAGVTPQGLRRVRSGVRADYQDRLLLGVAKALGWRHDWYRRLQEGADPSDLVVSADVAGSERDDSADEVIAALNRSTLITDDQRDLLLTMYRGAVARTAGQSGGGGVNREQHGLA